MGSKVKTIDVERRLVDRIKLGISGEFTAELVCGSRKYSCEIVDFHFEGAKIKPNEPIGALSANAIDELKIYYGKKPVGEFTQPIFLRTNEDSTVSLQFFNPNKVRGLRSKDRLNVKSNFAATVMSADPIKIDIIIHFTMLNFTSDGFLLETSLSNKHLLAGMRFENATVLLPGANIVQLSFLIVNIKQQQNRMRVGCKFVGPIKDVIAALARFGLFATLPPNDAEIYQKFESIKSSVGRVKHLHSSVRIEPVSTPEDYSKVLKIRYKSYKYAQKTDENATVEDMADDFDARSIIVAAKIDSSVVATVRLVTSDNLKLFPFESYVPFENLNLDKDRSAYYEVSRLAIDPVFQDTDILVALFKEIPRLALMNHKSLLCIASKSLRQNYSRIGFQTISDEYPHKILKSEAMAVMYAAAEDFIKGKNVAAITYDMIVHDVLKNLFMAGLVGKPKRSIALIFRKQLELIILKAMNAKSG